MHFDEDAVRRHVAMLHERARGVVGELVLAVYGENPETRQRLARVYRHPVGDVDGMVASAMGLEKVRHANLYMPLHVVRGGLSEGARGKTSDIVAVLGLVADMDADTAHAGEMPIEPSLVIETSPGNSQPIVLFDRPLSPKEAKPLAESLRAATKSDNGTADIAHVWRTPGTLNWPTATKLARRRDATPVRVRVIKAWDGSLQSFEAVDEALRKWRPAPRVEAPHAPDGLEDGADLPAKLFELIRDGVEVGQRSQKFMHAVGWLKDLGWSPDAIHDLLYQNAGGIAEKYDSQGRLRQEINRCFGKARCRSADAFEVQPVDEGTSQGSLLLWHGDEPPQPPPWLVRNTLPETGVALLAGQYGTGKTFVAADLSASVLTGVDFIGEEVSRRGGVLWLAAEGEAEVDARLSAVLNSKFAAALDDNADRKRLPFARQKFDVPSLTEKNAQMRLTQLAEEASGGMMARFGVPLALIVIDTLAAAACFDDENSASETQRVMDLLRRLSRSTGALVVAIDHFGKMTDTGVRGSSAKSGAADAILAVLAGKTTEGETEKRRLAVTKLRSGATGRVVPFELRQVPIAFAEATTCIVEWDLETLSKTTRRRRAEPLWTGKSRILKRALDAALAAYGGLVRPHGDSGPEVRSVEREKVRNEFYVSYSEGSEAKPDSKRRTFQRLLDDATGKGLVGAREVEGQQWLWLVGQDIQDTSRTNRTAPMVLCPVRPVAGPDLSGQMSALSGLSE